MMIPTVLARGLSNEDITVLEGQLKSGILAKQLRKYLKAEIEALYVDEEVEFTPTEEIRQMIGRRSGFRTILNLLPEDK